MSRPDGITDKHLEYLDRLRESGITNMFGAGEYLVREFVVSAQQAREILAYWMTTLATRIANNQCSGGASA